MPRHSAQGTRPLRSRDAGAGRASRPACETRAFRSDLVDEAGYLGGDLVAVGEKLGAPLAEIDAVVAILQGFDPPGVCARSLKECLAIQLKERDRFDPAMQALVERLDLLAKRELSDLIWSMRPAISAATSSRSARSSGLRLPRSTRLWRSCRVSIRRACVPAASRNASPFSSRNATASIPRCRRWSSVSTCLRNASFPI